eukprot:1157671-Pelagomonas_calceolata.AAC.3
MFQTTRLSKFISALLIAGFAVQWFLPDTRVYLALVPGKTLPMVWNLVSSGFLITNPIEVRLHLAGMEWQCKQPSCHDHTPGHHHLLYAASDKCWHAAGLGPPC